MDAAATEAAQLVGAVKRQHLSDGRVMRALVCWRRLRRDAAAGAGERSRHGPTAYAPRLEAHTLCV